MDLLLAIKNYVDKLIEYNYYPKQKISLGKIEKIAEKIYIGKYQKLSRYLPNDLTEERQIEFEILMNKIKEIVESETKN